jgi:hypothetical protein
VVVLHHQNEGEDHNLLIADKSFEMWQNSGNWEQA